MISVASITHTTLIAITLRAEVKQMTKNRVERRNVSIYPGQWAIIERKAAQIGDPDNISAGLRALVVEYEQMKRAVQSVVAQVEATDQRPTPDHIIDISSGRLS